MQPEFKELEETKYGKTDGTINKLNYKNAEWACKVVEDMITTLHGRLGWQYPEWLRNTCKIL